ncbi:MAG: adenylyltransferase/cytidyltransferase family protein [Spirochaetaceae bacterium]|jgi:FAD synthetase|nr:adenylyltransferase/cytidyltransferase family protein [Spirochaetaceae bacterium]
MKTVLVFGTFDVIHPGHKFFLQQSATFGDKLIAVIARDEFVNSTKKKSPVHSQNERMEHIIKSGLVDDACLSDTVTGSFNVVNNINPQIICFGHDQTKLADSFKMWMTKNNKNIEIQIIDPYLRDRYSSTLRNKKNY